MNYLDVGKACLMLDTEVYHSFAAVDQLILPHLFEGIIDTINYFFVEGKDKRIPIDAGAESPELEFHVAALFVDKVPHLTI